MAIKGKNADAGLADLLNYAHFIEEGIVINKDGAYLMTYQFRGPDHHGASDAQLDGLVSAFNRMALFLSDGWMLHVDALRVPSCAYAPTGHFPDAVSRLIDEERRALYISQGQHFENVQMLTFVYKFPKTRSKTMRHWFVDEEKEGNSPQDLTAGLSFFKDTIEKCIGVLSVCWMLKKLSSADLLSYLNTCLSGECLPVALPPEGCFVDVALGRKNVVGGYIPRIGGRHIRVLSLVGYLNENTYPGLLNALSHYPLVYRWSNRFIPLSAARAERDIKRYRKHWDHKVKGLMGLLKESFFGEGSSRSDLDAMQMSEQTQAALMENSHQHTRFGYWTSSLILIHDDLALLKRAEKEILQFLHPLGFDAIVEDVNALDAWRGSVPGHGDCHVRRFFLNALQVAHMLPLFSVWAGDETSAKTSLLPSNSPPVFYACAEGKTPFRFHMDVSDVGHQLVLGPTGSGKSVYLGFLIAQFLRYPNAQIFIFDKDRSHQGLTFSLGGVHYHLGDQASLAFAPLANLSTQTQILRVCRWVENLVELQQVNLTPEMRHGIHQALIQLSEPRYEGQRNLTVLRAQIQHLGVRQALRYYTLAGPVTLFDATKSNLQQGYLQTFETQGLLSQKPDVYLPVLMHLFDEIEYRLDVSNASRPTLIILEEAWSYIQHPFFAKKIQDWLKTLRKKNARVVFATQSPADLYDPSTQRLNASTAVLLESCPTKVFLPNLVMDANIKVLYEQLGLSSRQIAILSQESQPKQHYYITAPWGSRLVDLRFQAPFHLPLSFIALSPEKCAKLQACQERYGQEWLFYWLKEEGHERWAAFVAQNSSEAICV